MFSAEHKVLCGMLLLYYNFNISGFESVVRKKFYLVLPIISFLSQCDNTEN